MGTPIEITNSIGMKLKLIPAGEFTMGSPVNEPGRGNDEVQQLVKITKPLYLGVYEVTQQQYKRVMGTNPSTFADGAAFPVESVTWSAAVTFCRRLSELPEEKSAGHVYRLPSEAEWEYACRAGTTTAYSYGADENQLGNFAWFKGNSVGKTHSAGTRQGNAWGLFDMHGNVWEWCRDNLSTQNQPQRGGVWANVARYCRSSSRRHEPSSTANRDIGFRLVRELD